MIGLLTLPTRVLTPVMPMFLLVWAAASGKPVRHKAYRPSVTKPLLPAALLLAMLTTSAVDAQANAPLPARFIATVGMTDGSGRFANVTFEQSQAEWTLNGCISSTAEVCFATQRIVLTPAQRTELTRRWSEVAAMPRCEPAAFAPGDPTYRIVAGAVTYEGHLRVGMTDRATRTPGPCEADDRLAFWLSRQL